MLQRVAIFFLLIAVSAAASPRPAFSQDAPVFRMTVVGRTVPAVNYRPRSGETRVDFAGTILMPKAKGEAWIEGEKGYIKINAHFDKLDGPQRFGSEYLTYVLWAITPEGRATNLGELQVNGNDGHLNVTSELQAFALVVTAEPYFAVTQPSDVVVMENVVRDTLFDRTKGRIETVDAKYETLKRGSYLMNHEPSALRVKPLEPGAPLDLAEARNAIELARIAGADEYAGDTFNKADALLMEAENAHARGKRGDSVQQPARQAAQTAEDARLMALQRQEEEYLANQQRLAQQRESDAAARLRAEEDRRRLEEDRRRAAEDDRLRLDRERAQAEAARSAAEQARLEAERSKADLERLKAEADAARAAALAQADESRRLADQRAAEAAQARQTAEQAERDREALREQLRQQLNLILETRETARGLIINLSDVLFDVDRATLKPGAREKLARISGILSSHPDLKIEIEGHADSTGSEEHNLRLSERRAESVHAYMAQQGIGRAIVGTTGFGEERPVATNGTAAGRQLNRRVEIIVSGESIARRP